MNVLKIFQSKKENQQSESNVKFEDFYEDKEGFFKRYKNDLEQKHSTIELDSYLNITQGLLVALAMMSEGQEEIISLENKLFSNIISYQEYNKECINLEKILKMFHFFGSTRTHELKKKYKKWAEEFYKEHKTPIFNVSAKNGYTASTDFIFFVYTKIIENFNLNSLRELQEKSIENGTDLISQYRFFYTLKTNKFLLVELEKYSEKHPEYDEFEAVKEFFEEQNEKKDFFEINDLGQSLLLFKNKEMLARAEEFIEYEKTRNE